MITHGGYRLIGGKIRLMSNILTSEEE
jgi:hypothetical protein